MVAIVNRCLVSTVVLAVVGCSDGDRRPGVTTNRDAGPGGPGGGCTLVGDLIDLGPMVPSRAVLAGDDVLLQTAGGAMAETRLVTSGGVAPAVLVGLSQDVLLVGSSSAAFAVSIPGSVFVDGVFLRRFTKTAWVRPMVASSGAVGPSGIVRARAAATSEIGALAIVWAIDGEIQVLDWAPAGFSAVRTIPNVVHAGNELHLMLDADGTLHVLASVDGADGIDLVYVRRTQATWDPPIVVARAEGALSNIIISGLAMMGTTPIVAQTYGQTMGVSGATVVYRIESGGATEMGRVAETRVVASGLAIVASAQEVLVSVAYGENDLDPAQSMDSVDLVRCDTAGCKRSVSIRDAAGHFYEATSLARTTTFGLTVWAESPKLGIAGVERTAAQRFDCP